MNKDKYLLQLRDDKKNIYSPNCWGFFGGACKENETSEQCMKRELQEELSTKCDFLMKIHECMHYKTGTYLYFFYTKLNKKITKKNLNEGQDMAWFYPHQIKKLKKAWDTKIFFDFIFK